MTTDEWLSELAVLRAELGPTRPMRLVWRWKRQDLGWRATWGAWSALMNPPQDTLVFALFEPDADPGDRAVIEVEVAPRDERMTVPQGELVDVAGVPSAGHAVVVEVAGVVFWPVYPAGLSLRAPRFDAEGPDALGPPRRRFRLTTTRSRVVLVLVLVSLVALDLFLRWKTAP